MESAAQSDRLSRVRAHYRDLAADYDRKANVTCKEAYTELVGRVFADAQAVLELGAGSSPLAPMLTAPRLVAADFSADMLGRADTRLDRVLADAQELPFADGSFDGVFSINLLEHTPEPARVAREAARILRPGGRFLAVTPNGDLEWLLNLLERLHLKLPEGPHKFLLGRELEGLAAPPFRIVDHCRFLAFPAGPWRWARLADLVDPHGLFRYIVFERTDA
jgi:ubiquinone/menaquinone biosynthesis C-methylase UbiE